MYMDLGIPMKVEIQSDSSTSNSLTDWLGAGDERNTLIHFTWRSQYQEGAYSEKNVQMLE